jgi:uncharacterized protein YndB with AHSA1/START domain
VTAAASVVIDASPERVFDVLSDGWKYAGWVVGASHVRAVEPEWPQVGSKIHHSVGFWPAVVKDASTVIRCERNERLVLDVAIWFVGRGTVDLELRRLPGPGDRTEVTMREEMHEGLLSKLPAAVVDPPITARNNETLRRLGAMAERHAEPQS